jgi:hypothetical protein
MHNLRTTMRRAHSSDRRSAPSAARRSLARVLGLVAAAAVLLTGTLASEVSQAAPTNAVAGTTSASRATSTDAGTAKTPAARKAARKAAKKGKRHHRVVKHTRHHKAKKHRHHKRHHRKHKRAAARPARARTGVPGATNTGVPAATALTVHNGDINVTKAGTVISGLDVHGAIKVNAPNVTIKNSIIRFRAGGYIDGIHSYSTGLNIVDTEIAPTTTSPNYNGIMGSGFTATGVNVHGVVDAVHIYGNNVTIQNSWLHGNTHFLQDPNWGGKPSHDDSIQIVSGTNIRILNNTYEGAYNSGIQITQDNGTVSNVTIAGNVAGGGGCSVNVSQKGGGPIAGISVTNNRFRRDQRVSGCAIIRPKTTVVASSGNTWIDNGAAVVIKNGS